MSERPWPRPESVRFDGPAGAPVLVLGNSLGTTAAVWSGPRAELSRRFRVLSFELPGHGGSASWPGPYTIGELGAGVLALLDAHSIDRAGYCGISLGGMIGMWLAARARDRIAALGLVCTSAYLPPAAGWKQRAALVRAGGLASISAQVVGRWFTARYAAGAPEVIDAFRADLELTEPEGYAGCCEAIAAMDLRPALPAIAAPTLVIAGAEDPATPPEHGAAIADQVRGGRLAVIQGAGHLATVSEAAGLTPLLLAHLTAAAGSDQGWGLTASMRSDG
jgi:3-oxoadipate enol-lactonase